MANNRDYVGEWLPPIALLGVPSLLYLLFGIAVLVDSCRGAV